MAPRNRRTSRPTPHQTTPRPYADAPAADNPGAVSDDTSTVTPAQAPTATGTTTGHGTDFAPDTEAAPEASELDADTERSPLPTVTSAYRMGAEPVQVMTVAGTDNPVRAGGFVLTEYGWQPESQLTTTTPDHEQEKPMNDQPDNSQADDRVDDQANQAEDDDQAGSVPSGTDPNQVVQETAGEGEAVTFLATDPPGATITTTTGEPVSGNGPGHRK